MTCQLINDESLTVKRDLNLGKYGSDGYPKQQKFETFTFTGSVQPISGLEILQVPEGDRTRQVMNVFTSFELKGEDLVVRDGVDYEVRTVEKWVQLSLAHFKARIVRKDA